MVGSCNMSIVIITLVGYIRGNGYKVKSYPLQNSHAYYKFGPY